MMYGSKKGGKAEKDGGKKAEVEAKRKGSEAGKMFIIKKNNERRKVIKGKRKIKEEE